MNRIAFNSSKSANKAGLSMSSKKNEKGRDMVNVSILSAASNKKSSQQPLRRKLNFRTPHATDNNKIKERNSSLSSKYRLLMSSKEKKEPVIQEAREFDLIPHKKRQLDESYFQNHNSIDEADECEHLDSSHDNYELESIKNICSMLKRDPGRSTPAN